MTCKQAIWKTSYWGFKGIQEMCLRLRVNMDSDIRDVAFFGCSGIMQTIATIFSVYPTIWTIYGGFSFFPTT